jgi:hypothetical protein
MWHTCPNCGTKDAIQTKQYGEMQGDSPMSGWVQYVEIVDQKCGCSLTDEQEQVVVDAHEEDDGYDG